MIKEETGQIGLNNGAGHQGENANPKDSTEVPYIDISHKDIPASVLKEIPEEAAAFYQLAPIDKKGDTLEVGMVDPKDLKAKDALRFIARRKGLKTEIFRIDEIGLKKALKQYRTLREEVKKALKELKKELSDGSPDQGVKKKTESITDKIVSEAPITKIVAVILRHAVEGRASDVHIEPMEKEVKVRFRVDGALYKSLILPKDVLASVVSRIKILSNLKIDETRIPQDGRFRVVMTDKKIDFRVSTFPTNQGEKVVLRVLDASAGLKGFEELGLSGYNLKALEQGIQNPFGMILITGPTGSGKTTTLYAILQRLNQESVNIVSLEDPIEYDVTGVAQSQIRPEIDYTFASGLRHILRQDPDVIMVGEIRDEETAALAVHAALTGHILLSTLHTNNAIGVIPRLIDMGVGKFLLPPSMTLMIAQRLLRRLCPKCKQEVTAPQEVEQVIEAELASLNKREYPELNQQKPYKIHRPVGCKYCGNKGTKGRIALYEIIKMTPQLEEVINTNMTESTIEQEAQRQGMVSMKQDGIIKVLKGIVSFEEMMRVVEDENEKIQNNQKSKKNKN